jgi:hypothetical protein
MVSYIVNPCQQIRDSCLFVSEEATFVHVNADAIEKATDSIIAENDNKKIIEEIEWDTWHYSDKTQSFSVLTCQYIFVLDALNFCFWPIPGLEYDCLALSLKSVLEFDHKAFDAERLAEITEVIYIYLHVYVYVYAYAYAYVFICMYAYIQVYIYILHIYVDYSTKFLIHKCQ